MNLLFYQVLLVVMALFFVVTSFGEKDKRLSYADRGMTVLFMFLLLATFTWAS